MLFVLSTFVSLLCLSRFNGIPQDWQFLKARFDSIQSTSHQGTPNSQGLVFFTGALGQQFDDAQPGPQCLVILVEIRIVGGQSYGRAPNGELRI